MTDFTDYHVLDAEIVKETEKALLVVFEGAQDEPIWIPKSQVDDRSEIWQAGESGKIWISAWIAREKGVA